MASALTGAHKSFSMTTSRREAKYTIKNSGQDLDWFSTADNQNMDASAKRYIKVFQKLPTSAGVAATCEHQVQVLLSLSLKDSKNLN